MTAPVGSPELIASMPMEGLELSPSGWVAAYGDTHPRTPIVGRVPVDWRGTDAAVCDRSVSAICYEMVG